MSLLTDPIPYAEVETDEGGPEPLARPLPDSIERLLRYHAGDDAMVPPHWVRLRAARDAAVGQRLLTAWRVLLPLIQARAGQGDARVLDEAFGELRLDARDPHVQDFAAEALEEARAVGAEAVLFEAASQGRGPRFEALFARDDVPVEAHILRLSALREHGGMPWSEAFADTVGGAFPVLLPEAGRWALRLIAELHDPRARGFLERLLGTLEDDRQRAEVASCLAHPPSPDPLPEAERLPTDLEGLELGALDSRNPARQAAYLSRLAELDWSRARRLASSIATEDWRLDELVGALLNHGSRAVMAADFQARGLLSGAVTAPSGQLSARELLRRGGKVVRFDTASMEGVIDHDALAYALAEATGDALAGVDFLEEARPDRTLVLHAWDRGTHLRVALDTDRSIVDPYGLVGLINVLLRERARPERCLLAAEDKGMADVVVGPEEPLRALVEAGLLWIRSGFSW